MEPKVSIIVCTYNQEDTIGAALDSILAQKTEFGYEIELSDDCSTDGTADICRAYAERYPDIIRLTINDCNLGIADNYFSTLYRCRGQYIADLAGDDIWIDVDKLARQAAILDRHPEVVLTHGAWRCMSADGTLRKPVGFAMPDTSHIDRARSYLMPLLKHRQDDAFIHLCTAMYRRDVAIALTQKYSDFFYGAELPCEDFQLEVLMSASGGAISYEPAVVLAYRVGHDSASSAVDKAKNAVFTAKIVTLTKRLADELCVDSRELESYYDSAMVYAVSRAFSSGSKRAARVCAVAAKALAPYKLKVKTRIALAIMRIRPLWCPTRLLYNLISSFST